VWRLWWKCLLHERGDGVSIFLFCDSSPQRGAEFFAATMDVYDGTSFWRCFLPCIALDPSMMDTTGKTLALLWACWLVVGPEFDLMKSFCRRVVSITTDMGVERGISTMKDILPEFFRLMDPQFDLEANPCEPLLWPHCAGIPGWKHAWDLILQKSLSTLRWFPRWLTRFKSVVAFLRVKSNNTTLQRGFRRGGLHALADLVQKLCLPSFAEWRWSTLHLCLVMLLPSLQSLAEHFDATWFSNPQDRQRLSSVISAFAAEEWQRQTNFVSFMASWLVGLQQWGTGCDCHHEQLIRGEKVSCDWKGRRITTAYDHICAELARVLRECEAWSQYSWHMGHQGLVECQMGSNWDQVQQPLPHGLW
jgi:hypothetical protein